MKQLKIISIGNSAGVLLSKEFLTTHWLRPGDTLYDFETENGIALTAHDPEFGAQMALAEEIMIENEALLSKLAKS